MRIEDTVGNCLQNLYSAYKPPSIIKINTLRKINIGLTVVSLFKTSIVLTTNQGSLGTESPPTVNHTCMTQSSFTNLTKQQIYKYKSMSTEGVT